MAKRQRGNQALGPHHSLMKIPIRGQAYLPRRPKAARAGIATTDVESEIPPSWKSSDGIDVKTTAMPKAAPLPMMQCSAFVLRGIPFSRKAYPSDRPDHHL